MCVSSRWSGTQTLHGSCNNTTCVIQHHHHTSSSHLSSAPGQTRSQTLSGSCFFFCDMGCVGLFCVVSLSSCISHNTHTHSKATTHPNRSMCCGNSGLLCPAASPSSSPPPPPCTTSWCSANKCSCRCCNDVCCWRWCCSAAAALALPPSALLWLCTTHSLLLRCCCCCCCRCSQWRMHVVMFVFACGAGRLDT